MTSRGQKGLFVIVATCVGLAGPGCTSSPAVESVPYPADWPPLVGAVTCDQQSARFHNGAIASTYSASASPPASERILLSDILLDGGYLKHTDQVAKSTDITELNAAARTAMRIEAVNHRRVPVPSTAKWRCTANGSLELVFPPYSGGGESTLSSTVNVIATLTIMQDGDLAVRSYSAAKSVLFPGVSQFREGVDWIRFRRAE